MSDASRAYAAFAWLWSAVGFEVAFCSVCLALEIDPTKNPTVYAALGVAVFQKYPALAAYILFHKRGYP